MTQKKIFVTGISTDVGKTVVAAILTEALKADYWKPIQSGDLAFSDSHKVGAYISNSKTTIHPNSYALHTPMSPDAAAAIDGVTIELEKIVPPKTDNHLVIEGAGGILVPLNETHTIADLILPEYKVIVVSRPYLGSINHTLLTINYLKDKGCDVVIIFSGKEHKTSEESIKTFANVPILGRVNEEPYFDKNVIKEYAAIFSEKI